MAFMPDFWEASAKMTLLRSRKLILLLRTYSSMCILITEDINLAAKSVVDSFQGGAHFEPVVSDHTRGEYSGESCMGRSVLNCQRHIAT